jgi:hypothetical protein
VRIFNLEEDDEPTAADILEALYYTVETNIDEAVWVADDPDARKKAVDKFSRNFSRKRALHAADEFAAWLSRIQDAMPQTPASSGPPAHAEWWLEAVDRLAATYFWPEGYILWQLPVVRAARYGEIIAARKGGFSYVDDIGQDVMDALNAAERVLGKPTKAQAA